MASYPRTGPASRAVALDLVLRTFMNSADFNNVSNSKMWDHISKLVPGTTPKQCSQRWEELLLSSSTAVAGDFSGLAATGRPISGYRHRRPTKTQSMTEAKVGTQTGSIQDPKRPHSVMMPARTGSAVRSREEGGAIPKSFSSEDSVWGGYIGKEEPIQRGLSYRVDQMRNQRREELASRATFAANFCQNILNKSKGDQLDLHKKLPSEDKLSEATPEARTGSVTNSLISPEEAENFTMPDGIADSPPDLTDMTIHVCDDAKKMKKDFVCPRRTLVGGMHYFADYLTSEPKLWDDVDISVHCDVDVFEWLIRYLKQGSLSGPCGKQLSEPLAPPIMQVENVVSILISSHFLKMQLLTESCLDFIHKNCAPLVATPCNMSCISDDLIERLAAKFSILEVEDLPDRRDKVRTKFFLYHLEQLFQPSYSTKYSPANASTLYMCKHCKRLLTKKQEGFVKCTNFRMSIGPEGSVVYNHEESSTWNINTYIQKLQQEENFTPREIYWRIWSIVNFLECRHCCSFFQCIDFKHCPYHPQSLTTPIDSDDAKYKCCSQPPKMFAVLPLPQPDGCSYRRHTIGSDSHSINIILLKLSDFISGKVRKKRLETTREDSTPPLLTMLEKEEPRHHLPPSSQEAASSSSASATGGGVQTEPSAEAMASSCSAHAANYPARQEEQGDSELEEDDEEEEVARKEVVRKPAIVVPYGRSIKKKKQCAKGQSAGDYVWDPKKSKRWNIDMQRESDERRLQKLAERLANMSPQAKPKEAAPPGGIYPRLETQFRAQQAAKAMPRSHGSMKKKY